MLNFDTSILSASEHRTLGLLRERGAAVAKGVRPCAGKGGCGKTCARRAATILMTLLAMDGRRTVTLHGAASSKVSPDEMSLLCLIAASQLAEEPLSKALALWLAPASHAGQLRQTASLLGDILADEGNVLPLRFMAPPSRRRDSLGLVALERPASRPNIALPLSKTS